MADAPKKKNAFVAIHGHFYQPPRDNPWLEIIENEESADPFHDWNERIAFECYRPMPMPAPLTANGRSWISSTTTPRSVSILVHPPPLVGEEISFCLSEILEADRLSLKRFGHGNAIAQTYDHLIMPLANERDKETEVLWGIFDFEKRFHRTPDAMWLPETAVDYPTSGC